MPARSLRSLALQQGKRHAQKIEDVGDMPYEMVQPILASIKDPQQLHRIEINSPHIADADSELWRAFIARDFGGSENQAIEPSNPRSWWKVYRKLEREQEQISQQSEEQLRETLLGLENKREANKVSFITHDLVPKSKRQSCFGHSGSRYQRSSGFRGTAAAHDPAARKGQSIMDKVRREGAANFAAQKNRASILKQNRDMVMAAGKSQIKQAPPSMVREHAAHSTPPVIDGKRSQSYYATRPASRMISPSKHGAPAALDDAIRIVKLAKDQDSGIQKSSHEASKTTIPTFGSRVASPVIKMGQHRMPAPLASTASPTKSPATVAVSQHANDGKSPAAQNPATAPIVRKRATSSIFMPSKKRKL